MSEDKKKGLVRKARRERRLGPDAACMMCGENDLSTLALLEEHHVLGANHDPNGTVCICKNCHAKETERQRLAGADLQEQPSFLARLIQMLRSLGAWLRSLGEVVVEWAERLKRLVAHLDMNYPGWDAGAF